MSITTVKLVNYKLKQGFVDKARQVFKGALVFGVDTATVLVAGRTAASFSVTFQHQCEHYLSTNNVVEGKMATLHIQQLAELNSYLLKMQATRLCKH